MAFVYDVCLYFVVGFCDLILVCIIVILLSLVVCCIVGGFLLMFALPLTFEFGICIACVFVFFFCCWRLGCLLGMLGDLIYGDLGYWFVDYYKLRWYEFGTLRLVVLVVLTFWWLFWCWVVCFALLWLVLVYFGNLRVCFRLTVSVCLLFVLKVWFDWYLFLLWFWFLVFCCWLVLWFLNFLCLEMLFCFNWLDLIVLMFLSCVFVLDWVFWFFVLLFTFVWF